MKILHIISQTPDFTGSGKFIREVILQSAQKGHDNFLVAGVQGNFQLTPALMGQKNTRFVRFDGEDLDFPIPGMSDVMPYPSSVFSKLNKGSLDAYQNVFKRIIKEAIEQFKPDILHTHHLWIVSALARCAAPNIPMVTTCHGTCLRQHHLCPGISRQLINDLQKIDQVIGLSRHQQENISKTLHIDKEKINIISGGFNSRYFFNTPKKFNGTVELLYAGKLASAKGLPWLLKSLNTIKHLPFRLHMAGSSSGREKQRCLDLAKKLGSKVIYHGPLSHEKLGQLMRKAHVFILPSFFEGLPLVLMEALACGCRIITTGLPGVKEMFKEKHPYMVWMIDLPPLKTIDTPHEKDEKALEKELSSVIEKAVAMVVQHPQPDMEYVTETGACYAWEKIFSRIEEVYADLYGKKYKTA